jgi:hypothetical protein
MDEKNLERVPVTFRVPLWVKNEIKKSSIKGNRSLSRQAESLLLIGFDKTHKHKK